MLFEDFSVEEGVQTLVAPPEIQLLAKVPEPAADDCDAWISATHVGDSDAVLRSWLGLGPSLPGAGIGGSEPVEGNSLSLFFSLCHSITQMNIFLKDFFYYLFGR